jgi:Family of unknown function (DUF5771)
LSKEERNAETEAEKRQDERSKRKEDRHHDYPGDTVKHAGSLIEQGYRVDEGQLNRRTALTKAVHQYGYAETLEKLKALSLTNKDHKENHRRILDDLDFIKKEFKD